MFENGPTDIDDADPYCEGRPSTSTNDGIFARVNDHILASRYVTVNEIANELGILRGGVRKIIVECLQFRKVRTLPNRCNRTTVNGRCNVILRRKHRNPLPSIDKSEIKWIIISKSSFCIEL
ncbi:hypothetical protein AVEN_144210-1 [Araneus ventricosus]|uniref:Uncharacterized protein n=1 Tax=Araneus ventricosus TaxID=182803 RepID=A0A4Y2HSW2_ARAVE|nr:hypothetical protein AVEN_144210-1 [Araneus ventricosus]